MSEELIKNDEEHNEGTVGEAAEETSPEPIAEPKKGGLSVREAVLAVIAALAVVAAIAGFALYFNSAVPESAAAKVNDSYIEESDVAAWIAQYRMANSLTDDADFASTLNSMSMNVASFRQSAVNQLALKQLVAKRADELGIVPSDEEAQEQVEAAKGQFSFNDDGIWADTLDMYGLDEESLKEQYRANLAQKAVCEEDVPRREATEEEVLAYAKRYLAGTTQKHVSRIVFVGDDAEDRAKECYSLLWDTVNAGEMSGGKFSEIAKEWSDEEGVQESGGSLAWSGSAVNSEIKEIIADMDAGQFSEPSTIDEDDAVEIIYCDADYTFPSYSEFTAMPDDVPAELADEVAAGASESLWDADCDAYLANMLAAAKITYYPVPDDAAYNVKLSATSSKEADLN